MVERPARLFRNLLAETIRSRSGRMVLDNDDIFTSPVMSTPVPPPADEDDDMAAPAEEPPGFLERSNGVRASSWKLDRPEESMP